MRFFLSVIGVAAICYGGFPSQAVPLLLNGAAATVGNKTITLQAADFYRAVQRFREGIPNPTAPESLEDRKKTVQKAALEEMVFMEMKSFRYGKSERVEAEKIIRTRKAADKTGGLKKILSQYQKNESDVVAALAKSLEVEKFLQTKIDTLTPVITDAEIERFYRQNGARYPGGDLESNRAQIARELKVEKMQKALEEWVQSLREKYKFVNHLSLLVDKKG